MTTDKVAAQIPVWETLDPPVPQPDGREGYGSRARGGAVIALSSAIAVAAGAALFVCTRWRIGLTQDSLQYLSLAKQIARAQRLIGISHFPPLYPAAIAATSLIGIDADQAARLLQVVLFAFNIVLGAWLVHRMMDGRLRWSCAAAVIMALAPSMVSIHTLALSEPLFLSLELTALMGLSAYLRKGGIWLLIAAAATAAAALTRYAGIALIPAGVLGLLWFSQRGWRRRIFDAVLFVSIAAVPIGLWLLRYGWHIGSVGGRKLAFHPLDTVHIESALSTVSLWLFPHYVPPLLRYVLLGLALGAAGEAARRRYSGMRGLLRRMRMSPLVGMLLLFTLAYLAMLAASISFVDFDTPLDMRILSPLYPIALALAFAALGQVSSASFRRAAFAGLIVLAGFQMAGGAELLATSYRNGLGFSRRMWQHSHLLGRVDRLPPDMVIYTNAAGVIRRLTGRRARLLPLLYDPASGIANPNFIDEIHELRHELATTHGVLVYCRRAHRAQYPSEGYLRRRLHLRTIYQGREGGIYKTRPIRSAR